MKMVFMRKKLKWQGVVCIMNKIPGFKCTMYVCGCATEM